MPLLERDTEGTAFFENYILFEEGRVHFEEAFNESDK